MNKLEIIQKKLSELRLYREYLLKLKSTHNLNEKNLNIADEKIKTLVKK